MPRLPQVVSTEAPTFVARSPQAAAAAYSALADIGGSIADVSLDWANRSAELRRYNEVTSRSTEAALAIGSMYAEEAGNPDYGTLGRRVERRSQEIISDIAGQIGDAEARAHFKRGASDLIIRSVSNARDEQRQKEIGAARSTFEAALDSEASLAVNASGPELATIIARAKGAADGAAAVGLYAKDDTDKAFRGWLEHVQHARALDDINEDPLTALLGLKGDQYEGLDEVRRQQLIGTAEGEIRSQMMRAKDVPSDPAVYGPLLIRSKTLGGGLTYEEIVSHLGVDLDQADVDRLVNNVAEMRQRAEDKGMGRVRDLHAQAEQELTKAFASTKGFLEPDDHAEERAAALMYLSDNSAFLDPLNGRDPLEVGREAIRRYSGRVIGKRQAKVDIRRNALPPGASTIQEIGTREHAFLQGMSPEDYDRLVGEIMDLDIEQRKLDQERGRISEQRRFFDPSVAP